METNFDFLSKYWQDLAKIGAFAEKQVFDDPDASISKIGLLVEKITDYIFGYENLPSFINDKQSDKLYVLKKEGILYGDVLSTFYAVKDARNEAVHEGNKDVCDALVCLEDAHYICNWFMKTYGDNNFVSQQFKQPINQEKHSIDLKEKLREQEKIIEELTNTIGLMETEVSKNKENMLLAHAAYVRSDDFKHFVFNEIFVTLMNNKKGLKARDISRIIGIDRSEINSILYKNYFKYFYKDDNCIWHLMDDDNIKTSFVTEYKQRFLKE